MADEDAAPRHRSPDRRWQSTQAGPAGGLDRGSRRRTWLFLLTALFLTLVSAAIVWVLFIRFQSTEVFFLAVGIGEYNARSLPVNPFAEDDIKRLVQRFPKDMHKLSVTNSETLLRDKLKELKEGLPLKDRPETHLILYVSALAVVRADKVYVLPADADPDKQSQWIDVREILEAFQACPAKKKLLILDLAHALVNPRWGVLSDRVAETLEDYFGKNQPPFPVLCSCSAGQSSLTSEVLQGSVFAYWLDQGLQGRADTNDSQSVTVKELARFVEEQVDRWARANRGQRQQPRLFPKAIEDFPIVFLDGTPAEPVEPKLDAYPEALNDGWKQRDRLASEGAFQRAPGIMQRLEAQLLRQEDRWRRGAAPTKDEVRNLKSTIYEFPRAMKMWSAPRRSLALAGAKEDLVLAGSVARLLDAVNLKEAPDKKDPGKAADELVKPLKAADDKKADFAQQAWAVLQALSQLEKIAPDHLMIADATLAKLLDGMKPKPAYVDVLYVHRLAQFAKQRDPAPESKYFHALLQTMRAHQVVIAALDRGPEPLPWIKAAVDGADQKRRQAEHNLLGSQPRSLWPAALEDLKSARATYEQTTRAVEALQSGRLELDRAYASLPAFARLLCDWPEDDPHHQKDWDKAAEEAATLQAFLVDPPLDGAKPATPLTMEAPARELKAQLDELEQMLAKRIERAAKASTGKGQQQLLCLLANPLLKADVRADLLDRQRKLALKLHGEMEGDNPPDLSVYPPRVVAPMRARMSLALLRLAGIDVDPKVLDVAKKTQWNPSDLATLERSLHELWGRDFPDPWRKGISRPVADRVSRLRSPWDQHRKAELLDNDPTRRLQLNQREEFALWLRTSYQAELGFLEPAPQDQEARDFYARAAEEARP
jgi:hypothetical protein